MASTSRRSGNKLFGAKSRIINEWFRALLLCWVLLLCLVVVVYQTKLSKSTELFDLSELSAGCNLSIRSSSHVGRSQKLAKATATAQLSTWVQSWLCWDANVTLREGDAVFLNIAMPMAILRAMVGQTLGVQHTAAAATVRSPAVFQMPGSWRPERAPRRAERSPETDRCGRRWIAERPDRMIGPPADDRSPPAPVASRC